MVTAVVVLVVVLLVVVLLVIVMIAMMRLAWLVMPLLERFDLVQHLIAVEGADVPRLDGREAADRPAEMHKVRFDRVCQRMHPDLFGQATALARIAGAAGGDDVRPVVGAAA